jgi:hypothetical protein
MLELMSREAGSGLVCDPLPMLSGVSTFVKSVMAHDLALHE